MLCLQKLGISREISCPEDTFYIEEAEVDENNIITWNHELEQERKSSVFDLKKIVILN